MKALFDNYLKELFSKSNQEQVISVGLLVFKIILFLFIILLLGKPEILNSNGIWTLITALFSAPILFLIWRFRDQNATQQIENQRKDINLKEFQKIAEWVSGLHLVENEITEKETKESDDVKSEKTTKYTLPDESRSIPTFSKSDGAVGLQIAAIHSLLPFFRGEHGESFRRPALNLLTSAWLALQQKDLLVLEELDDLKQKGELSDSEWQQESKTQIKKIQKRANSPVGVALTQVLLSDGGDNLLKFPEVFPNLCLAGMNFRLPGMKKHILKLFERVKNCQGINLIGTSLQEFSFKDVDLSESRLDYANLLGSKMYNTSLLLSNLSEANLRESQFYNVNLSSAILYETDLTFSHLEKMVLLDTKFHFTKFRNSKFKKVDFSYSSLIRTTFRRATFKEVHFGEITSDSINDLNNVNFYGNIIDSGNSHQFILDKVKKQGGIILCIADDPCFRSFKLSLKRDNQIFIHTIHDLLDLDKTQQVNPDWEISIEEIE